MINYHYSRGGVSIWRQSGLTTVEPEVPAGTYSRRNNFEVISDNVIIFRSVGTSETVVEPEVPAGTYRTRQQYGVVSDSGVFLFRPQGVYLEPVPPRLIIKAGSWIRYKKLS